MPRKLALVLVLSHMLAIGLNGWCQGRIRQTIMLWPQAHSTIHWPSERTAQRGTYPLERPHHSPGNDCAYDRSKGCMKCPANHENMFCIEQDIDICQEQTTDSRCDGTQHCIEPDIPSPIHPTTSSTPVFAWTSVHASCLLTGIIAPENRAEDSRERQRLTHHHHNSRWIHPSPRA